MRQTREELVSHLREQLRWIRSSSARFDEGDESEAKLLATFIRTLVNDRGRNSTSLLKQLGVKHQVTFLDTSHDEVLIRRPGRVWHSGLAVIEMGSQGARFVPVLDDDDQRLRRGRVPFRNWWHREVLTDSVGFRFTWEDLVLALANQDGGTHVDARLRPGYAALSRLNSLGWHFGTEGDRVFVQTGPGEGTQPLGSPVPANVRQVAFEIERSLTDQLSVLLPSVVAKDSPVVAGVDKARDKGREGREKE